MDERKPHVKDGRLLAHLDGELSPEGDRAVAGHLEACESCRRRLEELRGASELVRRELPAIDVDAPDREPDELRAPAPREGPGPDGSGAAVGTGGRWRSITRRGLALKAALVILGVATAAAAVVPGSPLRDWVVDVVQPIVSGPPSEQGGPAAARSHPPLETVSIPVEDRAVVQIRGAGPDLEILVRMTDRSRLTVLARAARYETGSGSVEVWSPAGPELIVELPRPVASARISADGRLLFEKERGRIRIPGAADTTERGFALRPGPNGGEPLP